MQASNQNALSKLRIAPEHKRQRAMGPVSVIAAIAVLLVVGLIVLSVTRKGERAPIPSASKGGAAAAADTNAPAMPADAVLTVSGYVIPRERIEISPRFQGTVRAIHVTKGDQVKRGDVLVELEDEEQQARLLAAQGNLARARAALTNAIVNFSRQEMLASRNIDSVQALDDARRERDMALAQVTAAQGDLDLAQTYLTWCTIRAPIDGTILEKLVNPNELVTPMSFGGGRGPSTAFLAMADLADLQVEIDLSESDTPKVKLKQRCRVSPEAYPDKTYAAYIAEIAPEANRAKGTLQVKVQVEKPDAFLTPELSAKVDFLKE